MSTSSATIAFRVKPEIKRRADELFARLGMTTSTAMNVLLMQTLEHRGFAAPIVLAEKKGKSAATNSFEYKTDDVGSETLSVAEAAPFDEEVPNAETRAILERDMAGLEPSFGPFKTTKEMLKAALAMED